MMTEISLRTFSAGRVEMNSVGRIARPAGRLVACEARLCERVADLLAAAVCRIGAPVAELPEQRRLPRRRGRLRRRRRSAWRAPSSDLAGAGRLSCCLAGGFCCGRAPTVSSDLDKRQRKRERNGSIRTLANIGPPAHSTPRSHRNNGKIGNVKAAGVSVRPTLPAAMHERGSRAPKVLAPLPSTQSPP